MRIDGKPLTLRPATEADLDFAWYLYRALMKPLTEQVMTWHDINHRRVIEGDIAGGDASIILVDGDSAGWFSDRREDGAIRLCQLYVAPEMQNRGIGSEILGRLKNRARDENKNLVLEVMKNNPARALYERLGFIITGESKYKVEMTLRPRKS